MDAQPAAMLSSDEAARRLGLTASNLVRMAARGRIPHDLHNGRYAFRVEDLQAYAARDEGWMSWEAAAELAGCSVALIGRAAVEGRIVRRSVGRGRPSLSRESVLRYAEERAELRRRAEAAAVARDAQDAAAAKWKGPPDDGQVWLTAETAAAVMGVSRSYLTLLARTGRLPSVRRARHWFRRDHIEQAAAARAFARQVRDQQPRID